MEEEEIPSEILNERKQYIESALAFLNAERKKVNDILDRLGLTSEELLKTEKKQACPYNSSHIMPEKALKKHIEKCRLLASGCQKDELPSLLQDLDIFYTNADSILRIDIDENLLNKIIWDHSIASGQVYTGHRKMPVSHIDESVMLTQEDRLAIYQYVVRVSHEAGKVIPVDRSDDLLTTDWGSLVKKGLLDEQNNKQYSSKLEQLAALRDLKRRRQSYRAKNVHITKKSYTEIIREVISNQMEILAPDKSLHDFAESDVAKSEDNELEEKVIIDNRDQDRRRDSPRRGSKDSRRVRDSDRDRLRGSERVRERASSRERNRPSNYYTSRGKDRPRNRSQDRPRDRSRSRDRRRSRDRSRHREGSRDRSRHRERSSEKRGEDRRQRARKEDERGPVNRSDSSGTPVRWGEDKCRVGDDSATANNPSEFDIAIAREIKTETVDTGETNPPDSFSTNSQAAAAISDMQLKQSPSESDSDSRHRSKHKKHKHKKKHSKSKKHRSRD